MADIVVQCHKTLFTPAGQQARQWLHNRGLNDDTLRRFKIGYNPLKRRIGNLFVWQGVTIPHISLGCLWGCKVRLDEETRGKEDPKYKWIGNGQAKTIYNLDSVGQSPIVLVCEGEFDAMLAYRELEQLLPVITLGSATSGIDESFMPYLLGVRQFLVCMDNDDAGLRGADKWLQFGGNRVKLVKLPSDQSGFDLTDLWRSGEDLRVWLLESLFAESKMSQPLPNLTHAESIKLYRDAIEERR